MNELVRVSPPIPAMTISDVERVALAIAKGGLFGSKDPNAVLTLCLLAQAEGQHPAVVFRDYHIIQGKPAKKAEAMLRDFINAGGKVEWHTLNDTCADATFSHPSGSARIEWTLDRAKKAGISTPMWSKYPRQMLRSRVISEGIRTVYPGATSGLYEEAEVRDIVGGAAADIELTAETRDEPTRLKIVGIHKVKERLRLLKNEGNAATDLDIFNQIVSENKADLQVIKDGNHEWWTGDGEDEEGFKAWIKRRREELAAKSEPSLGLSMLLSVLNECHSRSDLNSLLDEHGAVAEALDGEESRQWEQAYNERETAIMAVDRVTLGA